MFERKWARKERDFDRGHKKRISFQQSFPLFKSLVYGTQDFTNKVYQFSNYLIQLKTSNLQMQHQGGTS